MEFFPEGLLVRLRSRDRGGGLYLYARRDDDEFGGVSVSPRRSSPNTVWEVRRRFQREEDDDMFVLCSSATGRFLAAAEAEESSGQRSSGRRAAAVQRDCDDDDEDGPAIAWRAARGDLRYGDVIVHDSFGRKLCVEAEARHGNGVFVVQTQPDTRGKKRRNGASRWFVEAALPVSLLRPVLTYLEGTGGGDMLQADAAGVAGAGGEAASHGQLVTALAFVAGSGNKGITALPLQLRQDLHGDEDHGEPSSDDDDDDDEPEPDAGAAVVVVGHEEEEEEQAAAAAQEEQLVAAQDDDANAGAVGGADVQEAGDGDDDHAQQIDDALLLLEETYEVMVSKHTDISDLVLDKRITAEEAAASRDWTNVDTVHRKIQKKIQQKIRLYDLKALEAAALRNSLVKLGVRQPPSPPPLLRRHPAHLLTQRRG